MKMASIKASSACRKIRSRRQTVGTCYAEAAFTLISTTFRNLLIEKADHIVTEIHKRRQEDPAFQYLSTHSSRRRIVRSECIYNSRR